MLTLNGGLACRSPGHRALMFEWIEKQAWQGRKESGAKEGSKVGGC